MTWGDLLPSAPMLLAHLAVAALVGGALLVVGRSTDLTGLVHRAVHRVRHLGLAVGVIARLLGVPAPVLRRLLRGPHARPTAPAGPRHLVVGHSVVRRGPPALLPS